MPGSVLSSSEFSAVREMFREMVSVLPQIRFNLPSPEPRSPSSTRLGSAMPPRETPIA